MQLNEYAQWTEKTCAKMDVDSSTIHMLLGMATELGELTDPFKKHMAYKKEIDWVNVREEVGDLMFYLASFCRINGLDLEEILETNVRKLETRYPNKFNRENAIHRDLDKERRILEPPIKQ